MIHRHRTGRVVSRLSCLAWAARLSLILGLWGAAASFAAAESLSDEQLQRVRDGFGERRDAYLKQYLDEPFHELAPGIEQARAAIQDARWIWLPGATPDTAEALGRCYARREFTVPTDKNTQRVTCAFASDNYADVFINGQRMARVSGFSQAAFYDVTEHVRPGLNVVALGGRNAGAEANPAGLLGYIDVAYADGTSERIVTDQSWQASAELREQWNVAECQCDDWGQAAELGPAGCAPWGPVSIKIDVDVNRYVFSRLTFALAAFWFDVETDRANQGIIDAVAKIRQAHQKVGEFGLHWMGGAFYRVYGLFGPEGTKAKQMSPAAIDAVWHLFADWAPAEIELADGDPERTWRLWGSENHSAQRDATAWAAARMLARDPRGATIRYADGSTPAEQLVRWRAFFKRYYRERISRGMLIEISPSGYGSRTLQGWHNVFDFTDDRELKDLAESALHVWWADWAQEQLNGMRGGGKTRLYPGAWGLEGSDRNRAMSWFYLGSDKPAHQHETLPVIATTEYRLPLVIMDIALDPEGRGVYECKSRRLGRLNPQQASESPGPTHEPVYDVDPEYGGLVRYSYCTPEFILGCLMFESRPRDWWSAISQQNRWHGAIFAGDRNSTLYPRCDTDRSTYNAHWAIQNKGTLIAQKLRHAEEAKSMRVCFSEDLQRIERDGWFFAEAQGAYAAVKIVQGGWEWDDAIWLRCEEEFTPVILEVVRGIDYNNSFEAFQSAVLKQSVHLENGVLRYRGLQNSGDFTFYTETDRSPELNNQPIDLKPAYAFDSPFLREAWASGLVQIKKGDRELIIDIRAGSQEGT